MSADRGDKPEELKKALGPVTLWGLGVGYVISGMYYGWNLGLVEGGPFGLLAATAIVTVLYVTFVFGYAELACALPRAGGAFIYANQALGPAPGFLAGMAQWIEFVFAPPAIAAAIGAYTALLLPGASPIAIAVIAYLLFTALNIYGVEQSAIFALVVTLIAVAGVILFAAVTLPEFRWEMFAKNPAPSTLKGIVPAIPFAIWFYLGIEGLANVAEESRHPRRDVPRGFFLAMLTLVLLALLTFFGAVGVFGWETVVYQSGSRTTSDSPLPLVIAPLFGTSSLLYWIIIAIGLCGLVASFLGIILVAGRATFEFGRIGYAPRVFGTVLPRRKTPAAALIANLVLGLIALFTGKTSDIIVLSVFGALTLYAMSMFSLLVLRRTQPDLARPYRTPGYPWVPVVALVLALFCLAALAIDKPALFVIYLGVLATGYAWFFLVVDRRQRKNR